MLNGEILYKCCYNSLWLRRLSINLFYAGINLINNIKNILYCASSVTKLFSIFYRNTSISISFPFIFSFLTFVKSDNYYWNTNSWKQCKPLNSNVLFKVKKWNKFIFFRCEKLTKKCEKLWWTFFLRIHVFKIFY